MTAEEWRNRLDQWPGLKQTDADIEQMWFDLEAAESLAARERERIEDAKAALEIITKDFRELCVTAENRQARIEALESCVRMLIKAWDNPREFGIEDAVNQGRVLLTPAPSEPCACCDNLATHVGQDGFRRCEDHRLSAAPSAEGDAMLRHVGDGARAIAERNAEAKDNQK